VNPAGQLSVSLLLGLVVWFPTFQSTMRGDTSLNEGALRYLAAFLLARLAVAGLNRLIHVYTPVADEDEALLGGDVMDEDERMAGLS